jgi:hypothetical protein
VEAECLLLRIPEQRQVDPTHETEDREIGPTHTHACATVLLIDLNEPGSQKIAPLVHAKTLRQNPILRKLYVQAGGGRKSSALRKGLPASCSRLSEPPPTAEDLFFRFATLRVATADSSYFAAFAFRLVLSVRWPFFLIHSVS